MNPSQINEGVMEIGGATMAPVLPEWLPIFCASLLALIIIGLYHRSFRRIPTELFAPVRDLFSGMAGWTLQCISGLRDWVHAYFQGEGAEGPNLRISYLIGAVLFTLLLFVFIITDFFITLLTLQGLMGSGEQIHLPVSLDLMAGASLICAAIFWGLVIFDMAKTTHLAPWERMGKVSQRVFLIVAAFCLVLAITLASMLGVYRGMVFADAPATENLDLALEAKTLSSYLPGQEDGLLSQAISDAQTPDMNVPTWQRNIAIFSLAGIPLLSTLSAAGAGVGPVILLQYLAVGLAYLLMGVLSVFWGLFRLVHFAVMVVWGVLDALLGFVIAVAQMVASPFVPLLDRVGIYNEISGNSIFIEASQNTNTPASPPPLAEGLAPSGADTATETADPATGGTGAVATVPAQQAHEEFAVAQDSDNTDDTAAGGDLFLKEEDISFSHGWDPYAPENGNGKGV